MPVVPPGTKLKHTVDEPGNVIHAGVWTGRYLGAVGYQYAVTKDPQVRKLGWEILKALRIQQEVTGKPGLLARGYMRGHGPVEEYERGYNDMPHWHQGQGKYADYRWYSDVSVDNFNAVLYGYSVYYDLAADAAQKKFIAYDVDRLMTHVLDNHCRIVDVDGKVTQWGHIGIDPDPAREDYYKQIAKARKADLDALGVKIDEWRPPLKMELMLLPDLLIAHHVTGKQRYIDFYNKVIARFKDNPDRSRSDKPFLERVSHVNHSDEGQEFEALYSLSKYEHNPELIARYNKWIEDLCGHELDGGQFAVHIHDACNAPGISPASEAGNLQRGPEKSAAWRREPADGYRDSEAFPGRPHVQAGDELAAQGHRVQSLH